jgi:hypothetical protein
MRIRSLQNPLKYQSSIRFYAHHQPRVLHKRPRKITVPQNYAPSAENGDSIAHFIANDNTAILQSIREKGVQVVAEEFKCVNNFGMMAVDLANPEDASNFELVSSLTVYSEPAARVLLDEQDIVAPYLATANDELMQNLLLATSVVNDITNMNIVSNTHPNHQHLDDQTRYMHSTAVSVVSFITNDYCQRAAEKCLTNPARCNYYVNKAATLVQREKAGNCQEYNFVALNLVHQKDGSKDASIFMITNSDHVFMVIGGDQKNADLKNYLTWGSSAVVIDAWANEVYQVTDISKKLKTYEQHRAPQAKRVIFDDKGPSYTTGTADASYNVLTPVNLRYHQLRPVLLSPAMYNNLGVFSMFMPKRAMKQAQIAAEQKSAVRHQ